MEEMKTELNRARTHSARLREEVHLTRTGLEKEQQKHKKTVKELNELKSLHETLMAKSKDDRQVMETRVQELENARKQMEEELSSEKSDKEVFKEEMERLRRVCDQLDEDLRNVKESFEKTSEENKELVKKMSDYNKNNVFNERMRFISRPREIEVVDKIANDPLSLHIPRIEDAEIELKTQLLKNDAISAELLEETRKDLARVTKEREDFKQKYEELEKQLEDTLASLERQRSASLHDRATSPGEPIQFEFEGKFAVHVFLRAHVKI